MDAWSVQEVMTRSGGNGSVHQLEASANAAALARHVVRDGMHGKQIGGLLARHVVQALTGATAVWLGGAL